MSFQQSTLLQHLASYRSFNPIIMLLLSKEAPISFDSIDFNSNKHR